MNGPILLVCNPSQPRAAQTARELADFLHTQQQQTVILDDYKQIPSYPNARLCISLGGDGTVLRCARQTAPLHIAVLAVNCGHLGFLSACEAADAPAVLTDFLQGNFKMNSRWLLEADILRAGQEPLCSALAFNDCVIKATQPRAFSLRAEQNGQLFKTFYGDGVIVATPTGSTAYSLAAGGPIVDPALNVWTVTPICPHSLSDRTILLPAQTELQFTPIFKNHADYAAVSLDGQENFLLHNQDRVIVRQSKACAQLVCTQHVNFFARLQEKLEWGVR